MNEPELEGFTYYDKYGYIIKEKRYHGNYFYKTFYPMDYFEEGWIAYSDSIFYVYDSLYRIDTIIAYNFNNEGYDKSSIRIYYYDCYSRLSLINNYYRNEYYWTISFFYDKRNLIVKTIMLYLNTGQTVINEYSYDKKKRIKSYINIDDDNLEFKEKYKYNDSTITEKIYRIYKGKKTKDSTIIEYKIGEIGFLSKIENSNKDTIYHNTSFDNNKKTENINYSYNSDTRNYIIKYTFEYESDRLVRKRTEFHQLNSDKKTKEITIYEYIYY